MPGRESTLNLTGSSEFGNRADGGLDVRAVAAVHAAYGKYHLGFQEITSRARDRFERRDWLGAQADATERLALYRVHVDAAVADVRDILQDAVMERTLWAAMKSLHAPDTAGHPDTEVERTFFNSVTRRVFATVGVDDTIEYLDPTLRPTRRGRTWPRSTTRTPAPPWMRRSCGHPRRDSLVGAVRRAGARRRKSSRS